MYVTKTKVVGNAQYPIFSWDLFLPSFLTMRNGTMPNVKTQLAYRHNSIALYTYVHCLYLDCFS